MWFRGFLAQLAIPVILELCCLSALLCTWLQAAVYTGLFPSGELWAVDGRLYLWNMTIFLELFVITRLLMPLPFPIGSASLLAVFQEAEKSRQSFPSTTVKEFISCMQVFHGNLFQIFLWRKFEGWDKTTLKTRPMITVSTGILFCGPSFIISFTNKFLSKYGKLLPTLADLAVFSLEQNLASASLLPLSCSTTWQHMSKSWFKQWLWYSKLQPFCDSSSVPQRSNNMLYFKTSLKTETQTRNTKAGWYGSNWSPQLGMCLPPKRRFLFPIACSSVGGPSSNAH